MIFKRKAYAQLKDWKEKYNGKYAALLEGPRRVGKSTIAEEFAKSEYKTYIKVDFSNATKEVLDVCSSISNLDLFFLRLTALYNTKLYERESVILFDEIQLQPKVRQAIKFLVKDGRYDYIETGSLLSIKKNISGIVIPSEEHKIRVYPMDYEEFLSATGSNNYGLLRELYKKKLPIGQSVNRSLMRDYRIYMAVGGMPQAVEAYIEKANFMEIDDTKRKIISLYEDDFYRIDPSGRISKLFESIPSQLMKGGNRFILSSALNKDTTNKDKELFYSLISSCTVLPCYNCFDPSLALSQSIDFNKFKLYLADIGLFVTMILKTHSYTESSIYSKLLSDTLPSNLGFLYENAIAIAINQSGHELYYMTWKKENSTHNYEIDFLFRKGNKIVPIEVKSSRIDSHLSIDEFKRKYSSYVTSPTIFSQKDYSHSSDITAYPFYLSSFVFENE